MKREKLFWGFFFILASVLLILGSMDFIGGSIFRLLMTIIFIYAIVKSLIHKNIAGIVFPISFIVIMYRPELHLKDLSVWVTLVAATLMTIGLHFLVPSKYEKCYKKYDSMETKEFVSSSQLEFNISFASSAKYVEANDFESLNLNCHFGACEVYFDHAQIKNDTAIVTMDVDFCGVALFIPKDWNVENHVECMFAGIDDKANRVYNACGPTLILQGKASFAGVEIHYI